MSDVLVVLLLLHKMNCPVSSWRCPVERESRRWASRGAVALGLRTGADSPTRDDDVTPAQYSSEGNTETILLLKRVLLCQCLTAVVAHYISGSDSHNHILVNKKRIEAQNYLKYVLNYYLTGECSWVQYTIKKCLSDWRQCFPIILYNPNEK